MPPIHRNRFPSSPELRVIQREQDFPWSSTGAFVVQHYVDGAAEMFPLHCVDFSVRLCLIVMLDVVHKRCLTKKALDTHIHRLAT